MNVINVHGEEVKISNGSLFYSS